MLSSHLLERAYTQILAVPFPVLSHRSPKILDRPQGERFLTPRPNPQRISCLKIEENRVVYLLVRPSVTGLNDLKCYQLIDRHIRS